MFCSKCGFQMDQPGRFCPKCGTPTDEPVLVNQEQPVQEPMQTAPTFQPEQPQQYGYQPEPQQQYGYQPEPQQQYGYQPEQPQQYGYQPEQPQQQYGYQQPRGYSPQPKPQKPKKNKAPVKVTAGQRIISIVLIFFIVLFSLLACVIGAIRSTFDEANVRKMGATGIVSVIKMKVDGQEKPLADYIVGNINPDLVKEYNIKSSQVESVLNSDQVKQLITNLLTDYSQLFIFGKNPVHLNENSVIKDILSLDNLVYSEMHYHFTDKDISDIKNDLQKGGKLAFLNEANLQDVLGFDPYLISNFFSVWVMLILILLAVALTVLLFLVNNWRIQPSFKFTGIALIVLGALLLVVAIGLFILSFVFNIFLVAAVLKSLALPMLIFGLIFTTVGIGLAVISHILKKSAAAA